MAAAPAEIDSERRAITVLARTPLGAEYELGSVDLRRDRATENAVAAALAALLRDIADELSGGRTDADPS